MRSIDNSFYRTKTWKRCRADFLKEYPLCEECLKHGRYTPATHVHHRVHLNEQNKHDASIAYGWANLEAVCIDCHNKIHAKGEKRRYTTGKNGELIIIPDAEL